MNNFPVTKKHKYLYRKCQGYILVLYFTLDIVNINSHK